MKLKLSIHALDNVRNTHPEQVWFFVCSTRRVDATVVEAHICKTTAERHARLWRSGHNPPPDSWQGSFEPVVRVGRVVGGEAETL